MKIIKKILHPVIKFVGHNLILFQAIQFMGMCILSVGSYALAGYVAHRQHYYRWSSDVGMALNTAILFVLIGVVILLIMVYIRKLESRIDALEKFN